MAPQLPDRISEWLLQQIRAQRSVAYLHIDSRQRLVDAGGCLDQYGLSGLQPRQPILAEVPLFEGLLPLADTPFLLRSVEMPSGRVADVHLFLEDETTWAVLLDVTGEHHEARSIQQKAYDMTLLSQREARLRAELGAAHASLTIAHRDLSASREALLEAHRRLQEDLRRAERYVRAILPAPTLDPFAIDWRYIPSAQLGGDAFGYHWIDDDHLALYVLDVCGHGLKAALLSVSAMNVLRNQTLPSTDFRQPSQVLLGMNHAFQMIQHDMMYLTLWYGVYEKSSRELAFASAGHPPAILLGGTGDSAGAVELANHQMLIGAFPSVSFEQQSFRLPESGRLYIFSDGIYEITRPDGTMLTFKEFVEILSSQAHSAPGAVDRTLERLRAEMGGGEFEDDVSVIEVTL